MSDIILSIIIPAKDEENYISGCLASIKSAIANAFPYEVIVVDNGSVDTTVARAKEAGATVVSIDSATISSLRNRGAELAKGEILLFLDADVFIKKEWFYAFNAILDKVINKRLITGSRCLVPEKSNWIEKFWFKPLINADSPYINSGHLIVSKKFFNELRGFSENLITGEDYDLCIRATKGGGFVENNTALQAVHLGYPKTILQFIKRERWHGFSDFTPIRNILRSKTGALAAVFFFLHLQFFFVWGKVVQLSAMVLIIIICLLMTAFKYRKNPTTIPVNAIICYFYLFGRSLALLDALLSNFCNKRIRSPRKVT